MKQEHKEFDEKHQELINSFVGLCLTDKSFLNVWDLTKTHLSMGSSISHLPGGQKLTKAGQDLVKDLGGKIESCVDLMLKDKTILKPKKDKKGLFFRLTLMDLLDTYADLIKDHGLPIVPDERLFSALGDSNFQKYKKYIFSKAQVFKIRIFLANFHPTFKASSIKLSQDLFLEKVDVSYFHSNKNFIDTLGVSSEAALVVELNTKRFGNIGNWGKGGSIAFNNFQYPRERIEGIIEKALTAFRLLSEGDVGVLLIQYEPPDPFSRRMNLPVPGDYQITTRGLQYKFGDSDLTQFLKIIKGLNLLDQNPETRVCVSRFNKSFIRNDPTDQLIDLVIAMESVTSSERDSLTYKVSTQIARLLINDSNLEARIKKRKELQEKVTKIYKIRSKLVHRGKVKAKDLKPFGDPSKAVYETRKIVRKVNLVLIDLLSSDKLENIINKLVFS